MSVLVDSSVWIDYFRGMGKPDALDLLIEENLIVTNDLILTELIPALHVRKQNRLIALLREVKRYPVQIDWDDITQMQVLCISNALNSIGIPDLIITQNAIQNGLHLLTSDKHFDSISKYMPLSIYTE
jgi:predicted nucleic acid-binding protein